MMLGLQDQTLKMNLQSSVEEYISVNIISSLPLSLYDSTTSTKLCKSILPFRQGKVLLAPARGPPMGIRRRSVPPHHHSARHHNITHETFTSLCGEVDHASLSLAETGSAQNRRWGSIGVVRARVMAGWWRGWWGYWIDRSRPSSAHTDEGKGKDCRRLLSQCK